MLLTSCKEICASLADKISAANMFYAPPPEDDETNELPTLDELLFPPADTDGND